MKVLPSLAALALTAAIAACDSDPPNVKAAGDPAAGRRAIAAYDCGVCHRIPGVPGASGLVGPPLETFGARVYIAGRFENSEAMLVRWIVNPPALDPSTGMPAVGVDEGVARDMAAYLLSLR